MIELLIIFFAQFLCVYLLGLQSLMVRDANCTGAAIGSFLIGTAQFFNYALIGKLDLTDLFSATWWLFIVAGPVAIVISIKTHPLINKYVFKRG